MLARLYKNTGFNVIDIPDGPHFFELNGINPDWEFNNVEILQINNIVKLTLDMNEWDGRSVDYVILIDTNVNYDKNYACYTVDGIEMQAPGVCTFTLIEDSFNTLGGFNPDPNARSGNEIIGGSANRLSVSVKEDDEQYFTAEEPFSPSEVSQVQFVELNPDTGEKVKLLEVAAVPPKKYKQWGNQELPDVSGNLKIQKANTSAIRNLGVPGMVPAGEEVYELTNDAGDKIYFFTCTNHPELRTPAETRINFVRPDGNAFISGMGTKWFIKDSTHNWEDNTSDKNNLLTDMLQQDQVDSIIGYWEVPKAFIDTLQVASPQYQVISDAEMGITGISNKVTQGNGTFGKPSTKVFNRKAEYGQSRVLKVYCPASGESLDKQIWEITNSLPKDDAVLEWCITADIRKGGSPIFMWKYISPGRSQLSNPIEYIKGKQWRNITLRIVGVQGEFFERMRLRQQSEQVLLGALSAGIGAANPNIKYNPATTRTVGDDLFSMDTVTTPASLTMGGNPFRGLMVGAGVAVNGMFAIYQQNQLLNAKGASAGTMIQVGDSDFFREARMNTFNLAHCVYSERDLKDFDKFLTQYGYAVNRRSITNADLYSRPGFNFVRVNDLSIRSIGGNINLINRVINQMKNGVRIWHRLPNPNDMLAGGNR